MFYSYTGSEHQKNFPSIPVVPVINAPLFLLLSLKKVSLQKKAWAVEKRKRERKRTSVQMKKMKKKCSPSSPQISKFHREICSLKEQK
jgi:biopolymer transport protein ExbB/TolQ